MSHLRTARSVQGRQVAGPKGVRHVAWRDARCEKQPPAGYAAFSRLVPSHFQLTISATAVGCMGPRYHGGAPFLVAGSVVLRAGQWARIKGQGVVAAVLSTPAGVV
jgi:hypothetical protein